MIGALFRLHRAAGGRALGRGVGQLERLLHLQVRQALDLEDAAGEDVLLALLGHGQQALLDRVERDRVDQVAQRDAGLHLALEAHQHRLGHVQRHDAGGGREGHQAGAGREADADREAGVAVAAGADGVGQQQAVQPGVDHAVARAQADAAAVADEGRQLVVRLHVHRLRGRPRCGRTTASPGRRRSPGRPGPSARRGSSGRWCPASRRWSSSARSRCRDARPCLRAGRRRGRPSSAPA